MYFNMITISTIAWICVPILYLSVAAEFHSSSWGWGCEGTNSSVLYIYQTPSAFGATQIWNRDRLSCSTIMKSEITFIKQFLCEVFVFHWDTLSVTYFVAKYSLNIQGILNIQLFQKCMKGYRKSSTQAPVILVAMQK